MHIAFVTYRALPQLSEDDRLAVAELRQQGATVESAVWDSPLVDWEGYDAVVIRSTWDYTERADDFEGWLAHLEHRGVPLWNPPALVRWNMDKRYLLDLEARGVATVPTLVIDRGSGVTLAEVALETGWDEMVFKPSISASAARTSRVGEGEAAAHEAAFGALLAARDMLVQPFVPEIVSHGEWSLLFFGGEYSHAVRKRTGAGDFRVQRELGGTLESEVPRAGLIAQAESIVAHLPGKWLFARVDACERDGQLLLMELELIEPDLFLGYHPAAARRFANTVRHLVAGRRTPIAFTPRSITPPDGPRA